MDDARIDIRYRGTRCSPMLESCIRFWAARLFAVCGDLERCEVAIDVERRAQGGPRSYRVRLRLRVPGEDLVVTKEAAPARGARSSVFECVHDAFRAARRLTDEYVRRTTPSEHRPLLAA
jgi:hypothetical protein